MISCTTPTTHTLPALLAIPSVTVMVVNLFYRSPFLLPEAGFGYLIPRSISFSQNPECALGVVYDSYSSVGQDAAPGTKVTVMLGGHWWDAFDHYPSEEEGVEMAIAVLRRHLNITDVPDKMMVGLQEDCIPQYTVGHEMRLKSAHSQLMGAFKGKLSVAGNWVEGVGLNDCVRGARDLVLKLKGTAGAVDDATGLEDFQASRRWVQTKILRGVANANVQGRDVD
jgi:oxygen-dependent protoporphyrinogen oxidase